MIRAADTIPSLTFSRYCAGAISQENAFKLAYFRGKFVAAVPDRDSMKGGMLAVGLSSDDTARYFDRIRQSYPSSFNLIVSCVNSPVNVTVSGEESQLEELKQLLHKDGVFAQRLRVSAAYHSKQLEVIADDCLSHYGVLQIQNSSSPVQMVSTVTGSTISAEQSSEAKYWVTNMIAPVLFSQAVQHILSRSRKSLRKKIDGSHRRAIVVDFIIEIGPHAALRSPIQDIIDSLPLPRRREAAYGSALYRKKSASDTVLQLMGELYCLGFPVNLRKINDPDPAYSSRICLVDLPTYPFNHSTRYWHESHLKRGYRLRSHGHRQLLGIPSWEWNPLAPQWRYCVKEDEISWLEDHKINGAILYPASAVIVQVLEAAVQMIDSRTPVVGLTLRRVQFRSAFTVPSDGFNTETRTNLVPIQSDLGSKKSSWEFYTFSLASGTWTENCTGSVEVHYADQDGTEELLETLPYYQETIGSATRTFVHRAEGSSLYSAWRNLGYHFGPSFQGIRASQYDDSGKAITKISLSAPLECDAAIEDYSVIHPVTLDSIMHSSLVAATRGGTLSPSTQIPVSIDKIWISTSGLQPAKESVDVHNTIDSQTARIMTSSAFAMSENQAHVRLILEGLVTSAVGSSVTDGSAEPENTQTWFSLQQNIDLDMLSPHQVAIWLEHSCGPDARGPRSFHLELQQYIASVLRHVQRDLSTRKVMPAQPHLQKYVDWIDWRLKCEDDTEFYEAHQKSLEAPIREQGSFGNSFVEIAQHIGDIIEGRTDLAQLLANNDLSEKYNDTRSFGSNYYHKLEKYVNAYSFKHPSMDILEFGAGISSLTKHMIKGLSGDSVRQLRCKQYVYTDTSDEALARAKEEFSSNADQMVFKTLDIGEPLVQQGCEAASFDVIIASNVVHTTKSLGKTLRSVRKLLKSGGKLILQESTEPNSIETGFVSGLLPEWWLWEDEERVMSPLVTEKRWNELLEDNGFSGCDFVLPDYADVNCHSMSIMFATAIEPKPKSVQPTNFTILVEKDSHLQTSLARQLETRLSENSQASTRIVTFAPDQKDLTKPIDLLVNLLDVEEPALVNLTAERYQALQSLLLSANRILWVTNGGSRWGDPGYGMIDGFARTFRIENNQKQIVTLALENVSAMELSVNSIVQTLSQFQRAIKSEDLEDYVVRDGYLTLSRVYENNHLRSSMTELLSHKRKIIQSVGESRPFAVELRNAGDLDTIQITEAVQLTNSLQPDEVEIDVQAVGLNASDFLTATGKTSSAGFGNECAGIVKSIGSGSSFCPGDRVCVFGSNLLGSNIRVKKEYVARVPEKIPFVVASTMPHDHVFASYLLACIVRLGSTSTVLIHGGHTLMARAVITLALQTVDSVFVTTPTTQDGESLRSTYGDSRVQTFSFGSFASRLRQSVRRGVDVVIDLSFESNFSDLLDCASSFGQVVHIRPSGRASLEQKTPAVPPNISFISVDIDAVLRNSLASLHTPLQTILDKAMPSANQGHCNVQAFQISQLDRAFGSLRRLDTREKTSVVFDNNDEISVSSAVSFLPLIETDHGTQIVKEVNSTYSLDATASYVVAGGFGDLGRVIVRWMASRGARNFILLSRSGPRAEEARQMVIELEGEGINVYCPSCDVADTATLQLTLQKCSEMMPPVKGCIQASGALRVRVPSQ